MKKFSFIAVLLTLLLVGGCGKAPKVATVGKPAPDFTLVDLSGKTWTLSELKGQVVFVNFWATWCPPCREEMPSMQRLFSMLPKDKFKMLAVLNKDDPDPHWLDVLLFHGHPPIARRLALADER